jgi:excisionase family DNA binding protein
MINNLVSKKEVVNVLNISKGKLDSMIRENEIPYIRLGKVIRFDMSDVVKSIKR